MVVGSWRESCFAERSICDVGRSCTLLERGKLLTWQKRSLIALELFGRRPAEDYSLDY